MNGDKIVCNNYNIKAIVRMKYNKNNEVIDMSDLDTSNCTSFDYLFYDMFNLKEIKGLNKCNLRNVRDMSYMCSYCRSLTSLNLSGCDLSHVSNMSYICCSCYSLTSLNLSGCDLSHVENMSYMCYDCHSLTSLNLSGCDLSSVSNMNNMCSGCHSLQNVIIDSQFQQKFNDIIEHAKQTKESLSDVDLDNILIPTNETNETNETSSTLNLDMDSLIKRKNDIAERQEQINRDKQELNEQLIACIKSTQQQLLILQNLVNEINN